jgi:putative peptide zinc metalloprotease protein
MQESAFKDPPWLLEREGSGYLQVNALLYHIAEQCNGRQTTEEIASQVSAQMGQEIAADTVRRLVLNPLITQGLVARADGTVVQTTQRAGLAPLQLNLKMAMVSPRVIAPLTALLRALYWPPILLLVLIAAAVAQGWMYVVHGVGGGVHDALYAPGLMLLAIAAVVLAAGFHELGHAAALRYAGHQVKAMGVGIYLVYPAFYTDVSDNYRLPRWARVRTDLGGFYFNLIFVLGVMALYVVTGHEFLLLVVVLINLEILHQLLPFVRLDGYWVLADLTGIPDFFTHMAAFVRGMVPGLGLKGTKLPELKWWAKVIFAAYILITVPLLLVLLIVMIKSLPRVLVTAWDSFLQQSGTFAAARDAGDGLGMAAPLAQMLLLALPTLGVFLSLYSVGKRVALFLWNWSKPSATRKAISAAGSLAAVTLLVYLWAPQLPFTGRPGPMYERTDFTPIRREERGTIFDAVGAPLPPVVSSPAAAPTPQATAAPLETTALPAPQATAAPLDPTALPTVIVTQPSMPTRAPAVAPPAAPPVASPPATAAATPALAATPAPAPTSPPARLPTVAPLTKPTQAPTPIR